MKQQIGAGVGLLALALVGAGDANAQVTVYGPGYYGSYYYGSYYGPRYYRPRYFNPGLPPSQAMRIVQSAGYAPLGAPVRRGPNYLVPAVGRGGGHVWVVVNAHEGAIMSVRPAVALQSPGEVVPNNPRVAAVPPADRAPAPHTEPSTGSDRGVQTSLPPTPSQRIANVPATAAVPPPPPERTPVPRPRPSVAANDAPATTGTTSAPAVAAPARAPVAAPSAIDVPEAPPAPRRVRPATPMIPVVPLD